jgi:hypothetical protein
VLATDKNLCKNLLIATNELYSRNLEILSKVPVKWRERQWVTADKKKTKTFAIWLKPSAIRFK